MFLRTACAAVTLAILLWRPGLLLPEPAIAQGPDEGLVAVGGEEILRVRQPAAGMSIGQRAEAIQDRLVPILSNPSLRAEDITAIPGRAGDYRILVRGRLLVTVTKSDAAFNKTTPRKLAQTWVHHMRNVLPQVSVRPNPNLGEPPNR